MAKIICLGFASVELWFIGQGSHDHVQEDGSKIPPDS